MNGRFALGMLDIVVRPQSPRAAAAAAVLVVLGTALYCLAYVGLQGSREPPAVAVAWSVANLLPWLLAFEAGKRIADGRSGLARHVLIGLTLLAAASASMTLELLFNLVSPPAGAADLAFEFLRWFPGAVLVAGLLLLRPMVRPRGRSSRCASELPLLPHQITWIKSAGNYLELRTGAGISLCRMTMAQAESLLLGKGFVRVNRSALVNRSRIARVTPNEVQLADGTWLRVGDSYRASLEQLGR